MVRIDMSEYMEKHSVSRLTGPPPGKIQSATLLSIKEYGLILSLNFRLRWI